MRSSAALFVPIFVLLATLAHADENIFDPDPQHPWNRLDAALSTDEPVPNFEPVDWNEQYQRWAFTGPRYERAVSELDAFVKRRRDRLIRDPLKRALLQSKLWAIFDRVSDPTGTYRQERAAIARHTSELVQRLALTESEIAALPDNYAATIAAKRFSAIHEPTNPPQPFLPPDLLPVGRAWLAIADSFGFPPAAAAHAEAVQGRSVFYVLIRLPEGISQTKAYTRTLATHPKPLAWQEHYASYPYARSPTKPAADLPQFPMGTQVALVRRMLLPDRNGELRPTPIIESIQIRIYVTEPTAGSQGNRQDAFEFLLSPKHLIEDGSGFRLIRHPASEARTLFEKQSVFVGGPCSNCCSNCHGAAGIYSVQTYIQGFVRRRPSPWFEAVASDEYLNLHALNWKKRQYEWGLLQGLWRMRSQSAAGR